VSRKATLDILFGKGAASAPERKSAAPDVGIESLGAPNAAAGEAAGKVAGEAAGDRASVESTRVRSGAIGAMGASLQHLKDSARQADALRQSLAAGDRVVALDPASIDPAPVADRFRQDDDAALSGLVESIRESGQQVPVLVRPHPEREGRWQAAYGHRRIRACAMLGRPVQAIVRPLTEAELAIAQGKENLERRDLSFIERAFFAAGLERAGFDRATISQALGADRGDVSRYIAIARAVPDDVARRIGPAPKAGRARWQHLVDRIGERPKNRAPLADILSTLSLLAAFERADSDTRFKMLLGRLEAAPAAAGGEALLADPQGRPLATMKGQGRRRQIDIDDALAPGFAAFVASAVPDLYARWLQAGAGGSRNPQE
jgi:ParB family transcriptional regulator, chromosome partitioning protein